MDHHIAEWEVYAKSAGITDAADIANVGHFMKHSSDGQRAKGFGANANTMADALVALGLTLNTAQREVL